MPRCEFEFCAYPKPQFGIILLKLDTMKLVSLKLSRISDQDYRQRLLADARGKPGGSSER